MKRFLLILALALLWPAGPAAAQCGDGSGERGVALLIGVSGYRAPSGSPGETGWTPLHNAVRDVDQVCSALSAAGFRTFVVRDPTFAELDEAVFDFHNAAQQADYAVVYYAGHGFEFRGQSYVVPVDAPRRTTLEAMTGDFMPMSRLLGAASASRQFGLFLLDACRTRDQVVRVVDAAANEPGAVGLVTVPGGAAIFSTVAGRPALDEAPVGSELSPFASAIVAGLDLPGLELTDFYEFVHEDVVRRTGNMEPLGPQYPALYKVAPKKFYLVEPPHAEAIATIRARGDVRPVLDMPPLERLAVEDEPKLLREILGKYSFEMLVLGAEAGNPVAQYLVGYAYEFGVGVEADLPEALGWLERSAAQDHPGGLLELAYFLQAQAEAADNGMAPEQREATAARARQLYERSAATGYAKAQSHLAAVLMSDSQPLPADERVAMQQRALGLFEQAADAGHVYANYAVAVYAPDRQQLAEQRLRDIAATGNVQGSHWLCQLYYSLGAAAAVEDQCEIAALNGFATSRAVFASILSGKTIYVSDSGSGRSLCRSDEGERLNCANGDSGGGGGEIPDEEAGRAASYWAQLALSEPELATVPDLHAVAQVLAGRPAR